MTEPNPKYPAPPITEAVIDIQFGSPIDLNILREATSELGPDYPIRNDLHEFQGQFNFGEKPSTETVQRTVGYRLDSSDKKRVVQIQSRGFTFSRLEPYVSWEEMRDEALRVWGIIRPKFSNSTVSRAAVRYINRINLPLPIKDLSEYLRVAPDVPKDIELPISGLLINLQFAVSNLQANIILNEAIVPPTKPDTIGLILDLDVSRAKSLPQDDKSLWRIIEELHTCEYDFFQKCISEKTKGLFK